MKVAKSKDEDDNEGGGEGGDVGVDEDGGGELDCWGVSVTD